MGFGLHQPSLAALPARIGLHQLSLAALPARMEFLDKLHRTSLGYRLNSARRLVELGTDVATVGRNLRDAAYLCAPSWDPQPEWQFIDIGEVGRAIEDGTLFLDDEAKSLLLPKIENLTRQLLPDFESLKARFPTLVEQERQRRAAGAEPDTGSSDEAFSAVLERYLPYLTLNVPPGDKGYLEATARLRQLVATLPDGEERLAQDFTWAFAYIVDNVERENATTELAVFS